MEICVDFPKTNEILNRHADSLAGDFAAYRNHVYRVLNFFRALTRNEISDIGHVEIAAAFHDLGIWTHRTFDYLGPSKRLAAEYLFGMGEGHHIPEVEAIIEYHHKITRYRGPHSPTVESFRRADLVDVSLGVIRYGIPRGFVREVKRTFPNAGFHGALVRLSMMQFIQHPLRPLPMFRR